MEISKTSLPCHNMIDVIDSRDIIERIEELASDLADGMNMELDDADYDEEAIKEENYEKLKNTLGSCWHSDIDELFALMELEEQCKDCIPDWEYGVGLIRYSYFTEYCRELVIDCGDIPSDLPWYIADHIDWEGVARSLSVDYTEVDFNGVIYFVR